MHTSTKQTAAVIIAASFASTIGGLPFNSLPILLGSLADTFGFELQTVGLLGSICFAGYLLGTLSSVLIISRFCLRKLTLFCSLFSILLLIASSASDATLQMPLWGMIGFFAALMTCLGLRIIGQMANKERALGVRQGTELGVTALVLFILPAYVISHYGYAGAAISLSLIIVLLSFSVFWLPKDTHLESTDNTIKSQLNIPQGAWFALLVFLVFATGNIALWAFLERMGNAIALSPSQMGTVFAVLKLLGGAAAFSVATAIALMHSTQTLHPPGGATALIAVIGSEKIHDLGFLYVLVPVGAGVVIMLMVALVINNLAKNRKYPEFWW